MKKIMKKAFMLLAVIGLMTATNLSVTAKEYKDLQQDHWAYKQIQILTNFNVVVGYPDGYYRPDQQVTRAEFASMVVKAFNQQNAEIIKPRKFKDVSKEDWYWNVVQRAVMFDLLIGNPDNTFNPYGTVTRGHAISTIVNALTTEKISDTKAKEILENNYDDYKDIPDWLIIAAGKAEILGMVVKEPGEEAYINANRPATRAELAAFICKMLEQARLNPNAKLRDAMSPRTGDGLVVNADIDGYIATIPAGTKLPIMVMNKKITCKHNKTGDEFLSKLPYNIISKEKYLLLVENDPLGGKIGDVKIGRLFVRNGKVDLETYSITTDKNQTASLIGTAYGCNRPEGFWKTLYLKVIKGHKISIKQGDILNLELLKPVKIDLTNGMIIE